MPSHSNHQLIFSYWQEICTHKIHITCNVCSMWYVCLMQRATGSKGSLWGWTGQRNGGVMKKWLKGGCWEGVRGKRQMVWGRKRRRDSKTRNRQWSRWIDFAGRWLGGIKNMAGLSCQWKLCLGDFAVSGMVKVFQGHLLCDIAALRS